MPDTHTERNLKSRPMTPEESQRTEAKVEDVLEKYRKGEPLTDEEWMIFQYARQGCGCPACNIVRLAG